MHEDAAVPEKHGKASEGEEDMKEGTENGGEDQACGDEEKPSQGGSYVCRFCDKAFSHAPARIQHERACAAALGVSYTRPGSSPTDGVAGDDAAVSGTESRKRKRSSEGGDENKESQDDENAKLAEELARDAEENWPDDDGEDEDGTKSPTSYAPFSKHDPNKPLPVWANDPDSTVITDVISSPDQL